MNHDRRNIILFVVILLAFSGIFAQTSITSTLDKNEITIGDKVKYTVEITYPQGSDLYTPAIGDNLGMFEIQDFKIVEHEISKDNPDVQKQSIIYTVSTFTTGDYVIPPIGIVLGHTDGTRDTLITQPLDIKVKSLLEGKNPDELDIRGIKAPIEYPSDYTKYYIIGAIVLIIIAIIFIILYLRSRKAGVSGLFDFTAPPKPAHVMALERLAMIRNDSYSNLVQARAYYTELTEAVREYIENIWEIPALEMTSAETLQAIRNRVKNTKLIEDMREVLETADMAKFAKVMPPVEDGPRLWLLTRDFVYATKPEEKKPLENEDNPEDENNAPVDSQVQKEVIEEREDV